MVKIKARDFVSDMRDGMDDSALMNKYGLTPDGLQSVFEKLIEADLMTVPELYERAKLSDSQVTRAFVEAQKAIDEIA
jgi:hypothetical protein